MTLRPVPAAPITAAVSVAGLTKSYGGRVVLDGIDLTVPEGTVFALLGARAAGKSTVVRILSTLVPADGGVVRVAGHELVQRAGRVPQAGRALRGGRARGAGAGAVRGVGGVRGAGAGAVRGVGGVRGAGEVRRAIGVVGQVSAVDKLLTAEENLLLMADLHHLGRREGRRRVAELLRRFELSEVANGAAAGLPVGVLRTLDLAMALVGEPRVVLLDEPTAGLDAAGRQALGESVRGLATDHGLTVLLTTRHLEEADRVADRTAVLNGGRIVAEGTAAELKRFVPGSHLRLSFAGRAELRAAAALFDYAAPDEEALALSIPGDNSIVTVKAVLDALDLAAVRAEALTVHGPDPEEVLTALLSAG
ncbi:ABC transporter ATP-binding protein [Kitasatospora sp. NBC_01246]|uniref:ABC transporter ATP-binding protein n=1 Tax=Kitasatospora sp. NBC_01246 TaxID=2903570 RepID=UPI002E369E64|nr:ABC transporter ATP-binding protein [Kitasatospora sp. NBC_01246]